MSTTKHDFQADLAKQIDDALMDVLGGGPGRREQAQREFAESVYPPKPKEKWPKIKAVVAGDNIHYVWDYGVFGGLPVT